MLIEWIGWSAGTAEVLTRLVPNEAADENAVATFAVQDHFEREEVARK